MGDTPNFQEIGSLTASPCPTCGKRVGTPDEWEGLPDDKLDDRCWAEPGNCTGTGFQLLLDVVAELDEAGL